MTEDKYCLIQDDDCHWYAIPLSLKREFAIWNTTDPEDDDFDCCKFGEYRLNKHISSYSFENIEEI